MSLMFCCHSSYSTTQFLKKQKAKLQQKHVFKMAAYAKNSQNQESQRIL